ncbi:MAG: type IV secretion IcmS family protein [Gammaproteobacteria bacterium]|nr:type IV secretion IcmS family protein [Gammaproteobacteria bacterium]
MTISEQLTKVARAMNINFSLKGRPLTLDEVFSPTGLLPGIARRADQLCSLCLGYGIGVTFEETKEAVLGTKVSFDEITPDILRLLCMTDVLHELSLSTGRGQLTSLDQLMYD